MLWLIEVNHLDEPRSAQEHFPDDSGEEKNDQDRELQRDAYQRQEDEDENHRGNRDANCRGKAAGNVRYRPEIKAAIHR